MIRPEGEKEDCTLSHLLWRVARKMDIGCFLSKWKNTRRVVLMAVFKIREVLSSFSIKYCILKFEFSKQKLQTGKLQKKIYIYILCFSLSLHHHEMISYFYKILPLSTNHCFSYYLTYQSLVFVRFNFFYGLIVSSFLTRIFHFQ